LKYDLVFIYTSAKIIPLTIIMPLLQGLAKPAKLSQVFQ